MSLSVVSFASSGKSLRIYYGDKVHFLCTRTAAQDVRLVMGEMATVVEAMLQRLDVDLSRDEIAVVLEAFNVDAWADKKRKDELGKCFQKICTLLGCDQPAAVAQTLASIAKVLLSLKKSVSDQPLDNRLLWSWPLHPGWRAQHFATPSWTESCWKPICWYISLKVNATTLERDLSKLLGQLHAHSGPLSSDGATVMAMVEVAAEGPQAENEFFLEAQHTGEPLGVTPFARLCQKLWITHFGRRFRRAYQKSADVSQSGKRKQEPCSTSWSALQKARAKATTSIVEAATKAESSKRNFAPSSFIEGIALPLPPKSSLAGTRWEVGVKPAVDPLKEFKKQTKRKADRDWA